MVAVRYRDIPDLFERDVRARIERWRALVPGWVCLFTVSYDDSDSEDYATASALFDQRSAEVTIHPLWADLAPEGRDLILVHELGHVLSSPLDQAVETIIEMRTSAPVARKIWSDAWEGFVNDQAAAVMRITHRTEQPEEDSDA